MFHQVELGHKKLFSWWCHNLQKNNKIIYNIYTYIHRYHEKISQKWQKLSQKWRETAKLLCFLVLFWSSQGFSYPSPPLRPVHCMDPETMNSWRAAVLPFGNQTWLFTINWGKPLICDTKFPSDLTPKHPWFSLIRDTIFPSSATQSCKCLCLSWIWDTISPSSATQLPFRVLGWVGWWGGVGWGNNVHVPARTQALHPHHTRAARSSWFTIGVGWGNNVHVPTRTQALHHSPFSFWWSVLAAERPKSFKTDLPTPAKNGHQKEECKEHGQPDGNENSWWGPLWRNGPRERAMSTANQMGSRRAGEVRFEGFGLLSGQNGPPERARSTGKQIKSRRGGEVPFEELGLLNPNTDHQKEQGAQPTRWEREKLGRSVLKDLGRCAAKTDHQKDQGAQPSRSRAEELGRPVLMDLGCWAPKKNHQREQGALLLLICLTALLALSGGSFCPLSGPNPSKRTCPEVLVWKRTSPAVFLPCYLPFWWLRSGLRRSCISQHRPKRHNGATTSDRRLGEIQGGHASFHVTMQKAKCPECQSNKPLQHAKQLRLDSILAT